MNDNFSELTSWLERIDQKLDSNSKRTLNRRLATKLSQQMKYRIRNQKNPSGRRFTPRKRDRAGSTKRGAMFKRLPGLVKTAYSSNHAEVGFSGRTAEVMRVHQYGQTIKPSENSIPVRYAVRETVGWSSDDKDLVLETILAFLLTD